MPRVLLVDDALVSAQLPETALSRSGAEIVLVRAGEDVAERTAALLPDAVVLGEGEACPDPIETCRRLRRDPRTARVAVVFVGHALREEAARAAGATVFVTRPVRGSALGRAVSRVLSMRERAAPRRRVDLPCAFAPGGARSFRPPGEVDWRAEAERGGGPALDDWAAARCENLSVAGALVTFEGAGATHALAGSLGLLRLEAEGRALELTSRVVRVCEGSAGRPGVGVHFEDVEPGERILLARLMRRASGEEGVPR